MPEWLTSQWERLSTCTTSGRTTCMRRATVEAPRSGWRTTVLIWRCSSLSVRPLQGAAARADVGTPSSQALQNRG